MAFDLASYAAECGVAEPERFVERCNLFRDYLLEHADAAAEYENLKLRLWKEFEHDRDGYTAAKTETVKKYTAAAKELYKGRYD